MPGMSVKVRADLAVRLRQFAKPELEEAARLLDAVAGQDLTVRQEESLSDRIWDLVSKACDTYQFGESEDLRIGALEAEMAGRTLSARLHLSAHS